MKKKHVRYDMQKKNKANMRATFRAVVSLYLLFLSYQIAHGSASGDSPIAPALAFAIGAGFVICALGYGVYTWRQYKSDMSAARLDDDEEDTP